MKVAHLTSVHPRFDTRIYHKQCMTLAKSGIDVSLVVADGQGDATVEGVRIVDVGQSVSRLERIRTAPSRIYSAALSLDADIYQIHDPELLPIALRLKRRGRRVLFDSHEDFPADILTKPYLSTFSRILMSRSFSYYERYACQKLDWIITATPAIRAKFAKFGCRATDINNFPRLSEFDENITWSESRSRVCYVGAMTSIRGVPELVDALCQTKSPARLALVGEFTEPAAGVRAKRSVGWQKVDEFGFVDRSEVRKVMATSFAGVVTFLPAPNHNDSQPNKMFEYMAAGLPVIGSHFPLWREILEKNGCGICVDPENPGAISEAIDFLCLNQGVAKEMGIRGREAILGRYNWEKEAPKLIELYASILGNSL